MIPLFDLNDHKIPKKSNASEDSKIEHNSYSHQWYSTG